LGYAKHPRTREGEAYRTHERVEKGIAIISGAGKFAHPPTLTTIALAFLLPLPVLRERAGVRVFAEMTRKTPHPNPLPAYREREPEAPIV